MGYGYGIKIVRNALALLAMEDELLDRMNLAYGEIRVLGASKSHDTSKKNQKKIDRFEADFTSLQSRSYEPRELEILSEKLVEICVDIIKDNTEARLKH
jgi:hypothetical protein